MMRKGLRMQDGVLKAYDAFSLSFLLSDALNQSHLMDATQSSGRSSSFALWLFRSWPLPVLIRVLGFRERRFPRLGGSDRYPVHVSSQSMKRRFGGLKRSASSQKVYAIVHLTAHLKSSRGLLCVMPVWPLIRATALNSKT